MKHRQIFFFLLLLTLLACQVVPTPPAIRATPRATETESSQRLEPTFTPVERIPAGTPDGSPAQSASPVELAAIPYHRNQPFAEVDTGSSYQAVQNPAWPVELPASLEQVSNLQTADGLTLRQRRQLARDGMIIVRSQEDHFISLHARVSYEFGQPYLLTTDAAYHSLKESYAEALFTLETEVLQPRLKEIVRSVYEQVLTYFPLTEGTDYEADVHTAAAYLGVALVLLEPDAVLDRSIESRAASQAAQIQSEKHTAELALLPGNIVDFRVFDPTGHYQRSTVLKGYYQARLWLERVSFPLGIESGPSASYQIPLIITLALRQARTPTGPTVLDYARLLEVYDFLYGHPVKAGPVEIAAVMDQAYSRYATILSLLDDINQERFRSLLREQPFPLTGTISIYKASESNDQEAWSFLGDREQLDEQILKRLAQGAGLSDWSSFYPGGLEIMSVMGSQLAEERQAKSGYRIDPTILDELRSSISNQLLQGKTANVFDLWLMSFWGLRGFKPESIGLLDSMNDQNQAWQKKAMNSALGAWVDFKADTSKEVDAPEETTTGQENKAPMAPAFVEPAPEVFFLLARLANSMAAGMLQCDLAGGAEPDTQESKIDRQITQLIDLGDRLERLGAIAQRELSGEKLSVSDYALIQAPLGPAEERFLAFLSAGDRDPSKQIIPLPGLGTLDYGGDRLVHIATGKVDRIYMLIPLDGKLAIAQGGIYSYYEFSLLRSRRLNDQTWLWRLAASPPDRPAWLEDLYLPEGLVIDVLAFRIGDMYRILPTAGSLSIHKAPGRDSQIVSVGKAGDVFKIVDGPQSAHGMTWWKVEFLSEADIIPSGWIIENQDWYERVWHY